MTRRKSEIPARMMVGYTSLRQFGSHPGNPGSITPKTSAGGDVCAGRSVEEPLARSVSYPSGALI